MGFLDQEGRFVQAVLGRVGKGREGSGTDGAGRKRESGRGDRGDLGDRLFG